MIGRFRLAVIATGTKPRSAIPRNGPSTSRLTRAVAVPTVLLCLSAVAVACSNGGSTSPSASANALVTQGLDAESSGNTQQAIRDFNAAVAKNPVSPIAYYDLGVIYQLYVKSPARAVGYYNKSLLADSKYRPALYNLAIEDTTSDPQMAVRLYNELLALNSNDSNVLYNLGLVLIKEGQTAQGESDINKAIMLNPNLKSRLPAGVSP